jgi:hypothetical protein
MTGGQGEPPTDISREEGGHVDEQGHFKAPAAPAVGAAVAAVEDAAAIKAAAPAGPGQAQAIDPAPPAPQPAARQDAAADDAADEAQWPANAFPWRTPARLAVLEAEYPAGMEMMEIRRRMAALPGPALPSGNAMLWRWVTTRGLKRGAPKAEALPVAPAPDAAPEAVPDEAPVALLPEGEVRETPQLQRARELLAMEMHPNDIKLAVRLSAVEFAVVCDEHKRRAWAA